MPLAIDDITTLRQYIDNVIIKADHHARDVNEICFAIVGCILWRSDSIQVYEREGEMTNALWIIISGNRHRYAVSYDHNEGTIKIKRDSMRGAVVASFTNLNSAGDVKRVFEGL